MKTQETMNLKISVKDGKACEKLVKIEVPSELVQKEFDAYYQAIASKAKIPGFRPGKAPRSVLEIHFAPDAREKVLNNLINESYRAALREKTLEPLSQPEVEDIQFDDKKLSYTAKIEVRPKIKLSRVTGLKAKKEDTSVKPQDIEEALKRIQNSLAQFKAVEDRPAQKGDVVVADYVCLVDGKEVEKREDDWFELGEQEFLKGFSDQLIGVKPGDDREVKVTFPENAGRKEVAGKPAVFQVKVKEIKLKQLPELNDDFAKEAGELSSLAELKQKIEQDLKATKEREVKTSYEKALLDELIQHNKIDLPERLVARRCEHLMQDAVRGFVHRGGPESKAEELKATLKKQLEGEARRQVHLAFLLEEIAAKESVTVSDEDLKEKYKQVAEDVHQPLETVEKFYASHEDERELLRDQIRNEKAIEFIKKNAKES